jgi:hypothetical protein
MSGPLRDLLWVLGEVAEGVEELAVKEGQQAEAEASRHLARNDFARPIRRT